MKSFSYHCENRSLRRLRSAGLLTLSIQLALILASLPASAQDSFTSQSSFPSSQPGSDISVGSSTSTFIPTSMLDSPLVNQTQTSSPTQPAYNGPAGYQNSYAPGVQQNVAPPDSSTGFAGQAGFGAQSGFGNSGQNNENSSTGGQTQAAINGSTASTDRKSMDTQDKDGKRSGSIFDPQNDKPTYGDLAGGRKKDRTEASAEATEAQTTNSPMDFSSDANPSPSSKISTSPLGVAVSQIRLGHLPDAMRSINSLLQSDSKNANAHYLKAVVLVLDRNFADARLEYGATLKYSQSEELNNRARIGLSKLSH